MPDKYKIFLLDGSEVNAEYPDIDEENRVVKVLSQNNGNEEAFEYIKKMVFIDHLD